MNRGRVASILCMYAWLFVDNSDGPQSREKARGVEVVNGAANRGTGEGDERRHNIAGTGRQGEVDGSVDGEASKMLVLTLREGTRMDDTRMP